ncbi:hypothetical protein ACF0H5_012679 [Mactra antiquata]
MKMRDGWVPSPRLHTPGRPRSMRDVYRPAVQDLSEQADRNGSSNIEETILSVVSTCSPRSSRPGSEYYSDKFHCPTPLLNQFNPEEVIKSSPTAMLCFNQHNTEYHEDLHRQRVLVSAHQRQKLHSSRIRRAKSTPTPTQLTNYASSSGDSIDRPRTSWNEPEPDPDRMNFVITNRSKVDDKDCKGRINYRLTSRTKPKSSQGTSLMSNGTPLSMINGYTQTLTQSYPKYSQKYSNWLTNGFKVQSFRTRPGSYDYSHSRPPPPLLQYINRPKTVSDRYGVRKSRPGVNFNVVGVQHRS